MEIRIITTYVICDEVLRALKIVNDPQSHMSHAEVATFGILAANRGFQPGNISLNKNEVKIITSIMSRHKTHRRVFQVAHYEIYRGLTDEF